MLQVEHEGKSSFAPPSPGKLQLLFSLLVTTFSYLVTQAVQTQCSELLCSDKLMGVEVNCGEKQRNSIGGAAQASNEYSREYSLDPKTTK